MPSEAQAREGTGSAVVLDRLGLRPSRQRLRVLEALAAERNDVTAQALHDRLRAGGERIGLATVYRTLATLAEHGVVDVLAHHPGETCYRLCSEGHHHHLVCTSCHRVVEVEGCDLEGWLVDVGAEHDFQVTAHAVEVTGLCAACREPRRRDRPRDETARPESS